MTDLEDIYSERIIELSANIAPAARLVAPDATATAQSKLCGSIVTVDINVSGGVITDFAQKVKACLLGQASAAIVAQHAIGSTIDELRALGNEMRAMLKSGGPVPTGKWQDFEGLECVRDFKPRHASTLLIFDALDAAFDQIEDVSRSEALQSAS